MNTRILIYCNNNFPGDQSELPDLAIKAYTVQVPTTSTSPANQLTVRTLALNVPTYITLYGYGYRNVYELNEQVVIDDPRIEFEGSRIPTEPTATS